MRMIDWSSDVCSSDLSASERDARLALYGNVTGSRCESLREVDEATSANEVLRRWLRLCFLHDVLEYRELPRNFGSTIKREYGHVWEEIDRAIVEIKKRPLRLLTANNTEKRSVGKEGSGTGGER